MPSEPLKQIYLAELRRGRSDRAVLAKGAFDTAIGLGHEVLCIVCGGLIRSLDGSFFLFLEHPKKGELVAMACSDICLRRARAHGIP
jgi:hypothetical protein